MPATKNNDHIILASDNLDFLAALRKTITPLFAGKIHEETSMTHLIKQFKRHSFKMIITDITLKDFDAFRLTRLIRYGSIPNLKQLPIIIVADTFNNVAAHQISRQFNANYFVPFDQQATVLPNIMQSLLDNNNNHTQERPHILVVDDNQEKVDLVIRALGDNYNIETAHDGKAGLKKFQKNTYNLIILDVLLPDTNGAELLKKFLKAKPQQKIIIFTAHNNHYPYQKIDFFMLGAMDYLEGSSAKGLRQSCQDIMFYDAFMQAQMSLRKDET